MSKVILDESLRARLNNLEDRVELCDEAGRTVGHFLPDDEYQQLMFAWCNAQVTDEELEQLRQQRGGRTLAEIWADLGQR